MEKAGIFKTLATLITTLGVIVGIVISVINFKTAKERESDARKIEASKPFLELRQQLYIEALNNASILASKSLHTKDEVAKAKKRFLELYWGELSLVEEKDIEGKMIAVARAEGIADTPTATQNATYYLAHAMRESIVNSWQVDTLKIGKVTP